MPQMAKINFQRPGSHGWPVCESATPVGCVERSATHHGFRRIRIGVFRSAAHTLREIDKLASRNPQDDRRFESSIDPIAIDASFLALQNGVRLFFQLFLSETLMLAANSANHVASSTPHLGITLHDRVIAALMAASVSAIGTLAIMVAAWFANALPLSDRLPPEPGVSPVRQPLEDLPLNVIEITSPEESSDDSSAQNEQPNVTVLDVDQVVDENLNVAALRPPVEPAIENATLPGIAEGTGRNPIGPGRQMGGPSSSKGNERRWFLDYLTVKSVDQYKTWLDAAGIQPGAVLAKEKRLVYLTKLTSPKPELTSLESKDAGSEKRLFFSWQDGSRDFQQFDRELFSQAGIDIAEATVMHFVSPETEARLEQLELEYAAGAEISRIRRTYFELREVDGRIDFFVTRQSLR